ncbi:hypothetical protein HYC85_007705 [Camellia sinensis]|uniref:Uncharacterized protein n=1 Tax=Camellia sinensis TaxID=4442 RepID=A0A7J7HQB7_CAMSI|nr:hypothetical protein HYC85_007705 [Camellia sinensis]
MEYEILNAVIQLLLQSSGLEWFDSIADKALSEFWPSHEIANGIVRVIDVKPRKGAEKIEEEAIEAILVFRHGGRHRPPITIGKFPPKDPNAPPWAQNLK